MRGDLCPYDHGSDPVVVENVGQYPSGPSGPSPHSLLRPPPPPGHINLGIPPPGFFPNRMQAPQIHVRPGTSINCDSIHFCGLEESWFF